MATDPLKPELNRALQVKSDSPSPKGITIYDIDLAISDHITDTVLPTLDINDERVKIPVIYGNPERWKAVQKDGYLRDSQGQIQTPLVMYRRNSIDRNDNLSSAVNRSVSYPAVSTYSQKHKYDLFSKMVGTTRPMEQYNITIPDYVTINYEVTVWTDFTEHMNTILEAFQYATDSYWGDKYGFKFNVRIDSFSNTTEVSDTTERIVRTTFNMVVKAYLLPETFNNQPTTNKAFTVKKVVWNTGVSESITSLKTIPFKKDTTYYQIDGGSTGTRGADWNTTLTGIPIGLVSGSSQIDLYLTQNFITFSSSLDSRIQSISPDWNSITNIPIGLVSGSSQVIEILSPLNAYTSSIDTAISITGTDVDILGDLTVQGSITATSYDITLVSASIIYESGSTKFGDTEDDTHQFTGSLGVSGSVSLTDNLTVGGTLIVNNISGSGSTLTNIGLVEKVWYVSEDGVDTNDGKTLSTPFRTIKAAVTAASASRAENQGLPVYRQSIHVKTGYYSEVAPITVPANTSILGDDLRTVVVSPTAETKEENLFLMNNGTYCWGLRLEGCVIDDLDDPRNGFFFAFAPNAYIVTSPYVQNCSAIHTPADKFYTPLDYTTGNPLIGNGPGGMIVDDSVLHPYSPLKSMIIDAYTQVAFNGIGICIRGRGYAQLVSFFTNFSYTGVYCIDGGHASLLNSNTTFGDYGLRAVGKRMLVKPDISAVSASIDVSGSLILKAEKTNIQNYMIDKLSVSGSYNSTYISGSGANYDSTITDSGLLIDALADDLLQVKASRTSQFTSGLFKGQDISSGSVYTLPPASGSTFDKGAITVFPLISNTSGSLVGDFILSYTYIKEYIVDDPDSRFTEMSTIAKNKVSQMLDVVSDTLTQVVVQISGSNLLEEFGSLVTSTSHDFSYAGAGVNFLALPVNQGGVGETNYDIRISEVSGGRVFHTSGDETGDFYAGNDFVIRQATGTIEGRTFTRALSAQFTPINLALES